MLSATPHQGDHFRFWMLIRLLSPDLFESDQGLVRNRHRLNAVVIRRTKADACTQDGSSLFVRRMVHTEGFGLSDSEKAFYSALLDYLRDGYNLAAQQGNKGRALGFVMTVFQKIAASSFAAIRSTLKRLLLMLTIQEGIERDELTAESYSDSEYDAGAGEESAAMLVHAFEQIWQQNSDEKIVIFATYLGTVDAIKTQLDQVFPGAGVDVLKGGDHGAKTAAQRRFRRKNGPKVLICTAAGREGINLQFACILFNYDLPWNWTLNSASAASIPALPQKHSTRKMTDR